MRYSLHFKHYTLFVVFFLVAALLAVQVANVKAAELSTANAPIVGTAVLESVTPNAVDNTMSEIVLRIDANHTLTLFAVRQGNVNRLTPLIGKIVAYTAVPNEYAPNGLDVYSHNFAVVYNFRLIANQK